VRDGLGDKGQRRQTSRLPTHANIPRNITRMCYGRRLRDLRTKNIQTERHQKSKGNGGHRENGWRRRPNTKNRRFELYRDFRKGPSSHRTVSYRVFASWKTIFLWLAEPCGSIKVYHKPSLFISGYHGKKTQPPTRVYSCSRLTVPSKTQRCSIKTIIIRVPKLDSWKMFYCWILFRNSVLPTRFQSDPA